MFEVDCIRTRTHEHVRACVRSKARICNAHAHLDLFLRSMIHDAVDHLATNSDGRTRKKGKLMMTTRLMGMFANRKYGARVCVCVCAAASDVIVIEKRASI